MQTLILLEIDFKKSTTSYFLPLLVIMYPGNPNCSLWLFFQPMMLNTLLQLIISRKPFGSRFFLFELHLLYSKTVLTLIIKVVCLFVKILFILKRLSILILSTISFGIR